MKENQGEVPEIPIVRDTSERDFETALRRLIMQPQFTHRWAGQESPDWSISVTGPSRDQLGYPSEGFRSSLIK